MSEAVARRGFPALAVATAFAVLADAIMVLALAWVLADEGRGGLLGALLSINAAARLLLMPFGGALADRYDKVALLRVSALARAVSMGALAWAVMGDHTTASVAAMTLLGVASAVHYPADRSVITELVGQDALARANGTLQTIMNTGNIAGPAAAAILISWAGGSTTFVLAGGIYLGGAVALLTIPRQRPEVRLGDSPTVTLLASTAQGVRFAWSDRALFMLLVGVGTVNLGFVGPFAVGIPALVIDTLGGQPIVLAAIEAAFATGSILGAAAVALVRKGPGWVVVSGSITLVAAGMALVTATGQPTVAVVVMLLGGVGSGVANVVLVTAIQHRTPRAYMGRVMSTVTLVTMGLAPVSLAVTGLLLERGPGGPAGVIQTGAAIILVAAVLVRRPARAVLSDQRGVDSPNTTGPAS